MNRDELDLLIKNGFLQAEPDAALTAEELGNLVSQGFLEELPNHFFTFHNNLTWEVIYETLLYAERRLLHNIIAIHIEKHNNGNLDTVADLLLYHFEKGRNLQKCVLYGAMAGEKAASLFANEDALSFYNRSITALDNIKKSAPADRSLLYEHVGDVYESTGNCKDSLSNYQCALDVWRNTPKGRKVKYVQWKLKPSTHEAFLARKIAMSLEHDSEYDKALQWLDEAEKLLPKRPGRVASQIAATKSATLYRKGSFDQAVTWGKQALKIAKRSGQKEDEAYAHNMIANSFTQLGLLSKAVTHLENAEKICVEIEDFPGIATANNNLGDCHYYMGDLDTAVKHYQTTLASDEQMHNQAGVILGHFNIGNVLVDVGELDKATFHLEKVIYAYKENNCRRDLAAAAYMTLSKCKRIQMQLSSAQEAIIESLNILSMDDQSRISSYAKLQYAEILMAQDKIGDAREIAMDILNDAKLQKAILLEIIAERILGLTYKNNFDDSLAHLKNSINMSKEINSEHEEALSIVAYTRVLIESGKASASDKNLINRAVDILNRIGAKLDLAEAKNLAGKIKRS